MRIQRTASDHQRSYLEGQGDLGSRLIMEIISVTGY